MYEDTPQELVHDLFAEAVFGDASARPAGDRHARRDLDRPARGDRALPPRDVHRRRTSSSPPPGTSSTSGSSRSLERGLERSGHRRRRRPRVRPPLVEDAAARRSASSARTRSSTTSASARPASLAPTAAASPPRSSTRSSAARLRRASSRRSARSAAWRTRSTRFGSQYTDTGQFGVYVGTREENLAPALEIAPSRSPTSPPATSGRGSSQRAKENLKGRHHALDGVDVEPDEPARQVADHRHRAALARADHRRDRRGRADGVAELAALLLAPERLSAAGIGPSEERFLEARRARAPGPARRAA